ALTLRLAESPGSDYQQNDPANSHAPALALAPAWGRGSVGGIDLPRAVAAEGDDVVAVLERALHAGRAPGHPGHGEAGEHRAFGEEAADDLGGDVPLEHVAVHQRGVAGLEVDRDAVLRLDRVH